MTDPSSPTTGTLDGGLAYVRVGSGPPLVYLPGLAAHHRLPTGSDLWFQQRLIRPLTRGREVWWLQRPQGLPRGSTMADIAATYAAALRSRFGEPVDVIGASTGGSVALQLAADHPDVVRRMVVLCAACRLGTVGRDAQRRLGELLAGGDLRRAGAVMAGLLGTTRPAQCLLGATGWLLGPALLGGDTADAVATIEAEDAFDVTDRLAGMTTPTLVIGGGRDRFYGRDLFLETAEALPAGHLMLHPRKSHVGAMSSAFALEEALRFLERH